MLRRRGTLCRETGLVMREFGVRVAAVVAAGIGVDDRACRYLSAGVSDTRDVLGARNRGPFTDGSGSTEPVVPWHGGAVASPHALASSARIQATASRDRVATSSEASPRCC